MDAGGLHPPNVGCDPGDRSATEERPSAAPRLRPPTTGHAAPPLCDPAATPLPGAGTETRHTTCCLYACRCGIRVHLRQGESGPEVRYIEGNPEHPLNRGVICAKGSSGIMKQYSPARRNSERLGRLVDDILALPSKRIAARPAWQGGAPFYGKLLAPMQDEMFRGFTP
jgi:hypothetical protein